MTGLPANHKCSGRANIDDIVVFQLLGEKGWTKSLVPANVATSEENHQRLRFHFAIPNLERNAKNAGGEPGHSKVSIHPARSSVLPSRVLRIPFQVGRASPFSKHLPKHLFGLNRASVESCL